jgi:hypothetical protein
LHSGGKYDEDRCGYYAGFVEAKLLEERANPVMVRVVHIFAIPRSGGACFGVRFAALIKWQLISLYLLK